MATKAFDINTSKIVEYTNKLEKLGRSDMPLAVRGTLNDAAFDSKQNELQKAFDKQFVTRKKTFIKSHTTVNKSANTFDINKMVSEMGIIKGKSTAGDLLETQELGGTISKRDDIPTTQARISKSPSKLVSKKYYLKNIKNKKGIPRSKNQLYIKSAIKAGKGGFIKYGNVIYEIRVINKTSRDKIFIKTTPVYSSKRNRNVRITKAPFISVAGNMSAKKIPSLYVKNAKKRFEKRLK